MLPSFPTVLALDFDGVICDGLKEYFQTAWRAYCELWQIHDQIPPDGVAERFYRLRPVVETGWEMPVVLRAIALGSTDDAILQNWQLIAQKIVKDENLDAIKLAAAVDGVRDRWIATNMASWLAEHAFYPGVIERLKAVLASSVGVVIISTKETRFIQQLLQQQGVDLSNLQIYGKDTKRPKYEILRELKQIRGTTAAFWFIEDRLKTLQVIQQKSDLDDVWLFLADWGYNTVMERQAAIADPRIRLISLVEFGQEFTAWL